MTFSNADGPELLWPVACEGRGDGFRDELAEAVALPLAGEMTAADVDGMARDELGLGVDGPALGSGKGWERERGEGDRTATPPTWSESRWEDGPATEVTALPIDPFLLCPGDCGGGGGDPWDDLGLADRLSLGE